MPTKAMKHAVGSSRSDRVVPLLDEAPVGHLQAIILKTFDTLGETFGYKVLEAVMDAAGDWLDPSQIYTSIRRMANPEKGFLEYTTTRKSPGGGPPLKFYRLTPAGRVALQAATAHYQAVTNFLVRKQPSQK